MNIEINYTIILESHLLAPLGALYVTNSHAPKRSNWLLNFTQPNSVSTATFKSLTLHQCNSEQVTQCMQQTKAKLIILYLLIIYTPRRPLILDSITFQWTRLTRLLIWLIHKGTFLPRCIIM